MPFITAERIHDGYKWLPKGTVIEIAEDGTIINLHDCLKAGTNVYEGTLVPGFVNVHCHLELSHMMGLIPKHTGLVPFLQGIPKFRNNFTEIEKETARLTAYNTLIKNGVVAIGDICNTTDTFDLRGLDRLHYFSFIEAIGFIEEKASKYFENSLQNHQLFEAQEKGRKRLNQSITPHAPYSVSSALFRLIKEHSKDAIISIHNQETEEENRFFKNKTGKIQDLLNGLGIDYSLFNSSGKSSLQTFTNWLSKNHQLILVHNTYTNHADISYVVENFKQVYWCFCPKANLYIENTLPVIPLFVKENVNICIGTDSLASNDGLSILSELKTIKLHYPEISWETLIAWGTANGARALKMDDIIGTIAVGKKPGIVQILELENGGLQPEVNCIA